MPDDGFRLPNQTQHSVVVGRNGTGKTVAAVWQLSLRDFDKRPWIIIDIKRDPLIKKLGAKEVAITSAPPRQPGLYVTRPLPHEKEQINDFLWRIHHKEKIGLFVDEGYMVGHVSDNNPAFRALLTQGRSKHISVITLSQRPAWMDGFVWSESTFFQLFALNTKDDIKRVEGFVPIKMDALQSRLPDHHSIWYDVGNNTARVLKPVPPPVQLIETFRSRLGRLVYL